MICVLCKDKPLVRGLHIFKCKSCNSQSSNYYGWFEICNDCSDKNNICKCCGNKITNEHIIGIDIAHNKV